MKYICDLCGFTLEYHGEKPKKPIKLCPNCENTLGKVE